MKKILLIAASFAALSVPTFAQVDPELATASGCFACHRQDSKLIGPSYDEVYEKYKDDDGAETYLVEKVTNGGSGVWGPIPMAPNLHIPQEKIQLLVQQILHKAN
ncbi:cytochrome c-551 [Ignatzschineria indica]|uniref:Cytochrome c-551 n=2 Tax=Ignatzschineria TaxID=112008 RepID=A0A2U2AL75_9GAMM|nr:MULTISPECIES: cytochrome C-551 [Ignatzschineria]OYQ80550.1 cytochrome C-551 [Ignatzschineria sp. F8392]PWD82669.1 cytochrome C-551 [Ignatzschineria indica]PWD83945.1 cytochrome C-551 [Ignatzschineria cameli]PWD85405.1 cytochrome C-551 [Ignatzschineria cameli]PWD88880.1 cytochrome C-551 [Ignatzschineria cameli]